MFNLPKTPPPISPLPPTPPVENVTKKSQPKMSAAVMEAMERCKSLKAEASKSKVHIKSTYGLKYSVVLAQDFTVNLKNCEMVMSVAVKQ